MAAITMINFSRRGRLLGVALAISLQPTMLAAQSIGNLPMDDERAKYERLFSADQFSEAADAAKRSIAQLLGDPDHDRMLYGELLTQLADAQHHGKSFAAATNNYLLAIEVIEAHKDRLCLELIRPMLSLSRNYQANGHFIDAVKSYERTLHIQQVNSGLYGVEKAMVVAELSESYFQLGDFKRANAMQDSYVTITERANPGADLARLPSMYSRADMLTRTNASFRSLDAYRRIIAMIERVDGTQSLQLIPAFMAVSRLLVRQHILDGDDGFEKARRYLRRAADIIEKSESADARLKASVFIGIGDFLSTQTPNRKSVIQSYQRGWDALSGDQQFLNERDELFAEPILLNPVPAGSPSDMLKLLANADDPNNVKNGRLIVNYDINKGGRPENIKIVEAIPAERYDYLVKSHVDRFAFRPHFSNGEAMASPNQVFELLFSYETEEIAEKVRQNGAQSIASENKP